MTEKKSNDLDTNRLDYFVATFKGAAGIIPMFGPPIAEAVGTLIPNQRVDRIVKFALELESRVEDVETIIEKIRTPEGLDLLEDALYQSTRAMTDERRIYLANMLKNGLTKEEQTHAEKKKLFDILNQLNDNEIILLKLYSLNLTIGQKPPFVTKHYDLIRPPSREQGVSDEERNRAIYRDTYNRTLHSLGLVTNDTRHLTKDMETKSLSSTMPTVATPLGHLLLEYIEVPEE